MNKIFVDRSLVKNYVENYLLSHISKMKRSSKYWMFRCPICGDSNKNKSKMRGYYYKSTNSFHCFNCDKSAEGLYVITKLFGVNYKTILKEYLDYIRTDYSTPVEELPEPKKTIETSPHIYRTFDKLNQKCIDFLEKRKIFNAPYLDGKDFLYDSEEDKLIIPWNEKLYQTRVLGKSTGNKYKFEPYGFEKDIYGLDEINPNENIFFLEGIFDKIFVYNSICIGGIYPTSHQFDILERELIDKDNLVFLPDNYWVDLSSRKKLFQLHKNNKNIKVFHWDKKNKSKDINDNILKTGNINLYNKNYVNKNIIKLDKLIVEIKFNKV